MNPEDKIVAAIDRCTTAVENQSAWLKVDEEDPLLPVLQDIREWMKAVFILIVCVAALILVAISSAKAAPLVYDGDEIASVGTVQEVRR